MSLDQMNTEELNTLAQEIRKRIIDVLAKSGGHLASNLGIVELTIGLHATFNSPKDKFIFDVSHQSYPHKILTGRNDKFDSLRQYQGISGFCNPPESEHDHFYAGHAGTALSLALGVAKSRDLEGGSEHIIPILGDAALTCGLTLEALNNIPQDLSRFLILLNDNAMSISKNVGAVKNLINAPFFKQFGLHYIGPIDGHNIESIIETLEALKDVQQPTIVHVLTVKGQGMENAMKNPTPYHGVKSFDPETGKFYPTISQDPSFPEIFGKTLLKMAERDSDIMAITPAMPFGSCLTEFMERYPERCLDVGIAEGHAVTLAGGLSFSHKKKVFVSIYATFLLRALDGVFHDICLQRFPVIFAIDRAGIAGGDGETHNGLYDIGFLYAMPEMIIAQPRNGQLLRELLESAVLWKKPTAIRYPNRETIEGSLPLTIRSPGKGEILKKGEDLAIIALGSLCDTAFAVAKSLEKEGIHATIVDPIFLKPLDKSLFYNLFLHHKKVITIEEHSVRTGLGSIINTFLVQHQLSNVQVKNFGVPDIFVPQGDYTHLMEDLGLSPQAITKQVLTSFSFNKDRVRAFL